MIQAGKNYVYGSTARKLETPAKPIYDVYEENKVLKEKKKARKNNKVRLKTVGYVMVIFSCCLLMMYRYALITELNYNISKLEKIYNEKVNENSRLKIAIEEDTDLDRIKQLAEEKLGMQKPDRYQIVYINVPKSDFTTVSGTYKDRDGSADTGNLLAALGRKVGRFLRLLY